MNGRRFTVGLPANPLLQAAYFIVGGIVLVVAIFMGAIVLLVVFGLALIAGIAIWMRLWWLQRKMLKARAGHPGAEARRRGETGQVIEVEYTVVDEQRK
jgi:hypothetical protein